MKLKDIIKEKDLKNKIVTARVSSNTKKYIKKKKINVGKLIEKSIKELKGDVN